MAVNDDIRNALESYGGFSINERVYNYLGSLGYTGTISDRLAAYSYQNKIGWQALIAEFAGGAVDPILALFANGEQGAWYDPSDLTTLSQDAAGATPVTADGDPVGLMLDKSGNGNHASQSTSAARPIYRTDGALHWLEFDGVDDNIQLNGNILSLYSGAQMAHILMAARPDTSGTAIISGFLAPEPESVSNVFLNCNLSTSQVGAEGRWSPADNYNTSSRNNRAAPADSVAVFEWGGSNGVQRVRENAVDLIETTPYTPGPSGFVGDSGGAAIGAQGDNRFNFTGRVYGAIYLKDREGMDFSLVEQFLANKAGVTL